LRNPLRPHNHPRQRRLILGRPININAPQEMEDGDEEEDEGCDLG
jgi:hypothetical protein